MSYWEIFIIGVGLSMDAFAVSICKGLSLKKMSLKNALAAGLYFGGFQALMPLLGWLLGSSFARYIAMVGHWITFVLLAFIGGSMIREAVAESRAKKAAANASADLQGGEGTGASADGGEANANAKGSAGRNSDFGPKAMIPMAIATSIDAFAVGVSFSFFPVNIFMAIAIIGCTTFVFGVAGVRIGLLFGEKWSEKAEFAGGVILILIGLFILLEHLGVFGG